MNLVGFVELLSNRHVSVLMEDVERDLITSTICAQSIDSGMPAISIEMRPGAMAYRKWSRQTS